MDTWTRGGQDLSFEGLIFSEAAVAYDVDCAFAVRIYAEDGCAHFYVFVSSHQSEGVSILKIRILKRHVCLGKQIR